MLRPSAGETLRAWLLSALVVHGAVAGNPDAKRLYDDLLSNYNKLVRPVVNTSDVLRVCIKLKLSQLIDVLPPSSAIYSESPGLSNRKLLHSMQDFTSFWKVDPELKADFDKPKKDTRDIFPFTTYSGHSSASEENFSKDLEEKLQKMSRLERGRKSKLISNPVEVELTKRKNANNPCILKSKKKSHKVNRSEALSKKFRNVDSMSELKKILENFRIVGEEDLNKNRFRCKNSRNIIPAYFVLKLADKSGKNSVGVEETHPSKSQSFKLIFANDETGNDMTEKAISCPSWSTIDCRSDVKMIDKISQTSDNDDKSDKPKQKINMQDAVVVAKPEEKTEDPMLNNLQKVCCDCLKMTENLEYQKQFNASLLELIKNLMTQLTSTMGVFNDLLTCKSRKNFFSEDPIIKGNNFENFLKGSPIVNGNDFANSFNENNSEKIIADHDFEIADVLSCSSQMRLNFEFLTREESFESSVVSKKPSEYNSKDILPAFSPEKLKDVYSARDNLNQKRKDQLRRKIESCVSHIDISQIMPSRTASATTEEVNLNSTSKDQLDKIPSLEENVNECNEAVRDQKIKEKDLNEEEDDADSDDFSDIIPNEFIKTETELDEDSVQLMKKESVRCTKTETGYESTGARSFSNANTPLKNVSQVSSRTDVKERNRNTNKKKRNKKSSPKKKALRNVFSRMFSKKKNS